MSKNCSTDEWFIHSQRNNFLKNPYFSTQDFMLFTHFDLCCHFKTATCLTFCQKKRTTVFPYIRLAGIIFSFVFYSKVRVHTYINVWVLLEHGCYSREDFVWRTKIAFHYAEDMSKSSSQIQMSTYSINKWSCISLQIMCCFCCDNLHMLTFVSSKVNFKIGITLIFLSLLHSNKALRICQVFMVSDWCQVYAT